MGSVRITVEVPELRPGSTKSASVANYVRAAMKVQALRQEFAQALIDLKTCKQVLCKRVPADSLWAETQALCDELHIEAANR
jgi:hypothetical protein